MSVRVIHGDMREELAKLPDEIVFHGSWREDAETAVQTYGPGSGNRMARSTNGGMSQSEYETTGWSPSCNCDAGVARGTVLDPFFGAGTTGLVADRLQRNCIGIELNPEYAALAKERLEGDGPLFSDVQTFRPAPSGSSAAEDTEAE